MSGELVVCSTFKLTIVDSMEHCKLIALILERSTAVVSAVALIIYAGVIKRMDEKEESSV